MATDLTDEIAAAATEPAEGAVDGQHVKARTIDEMIKADQYAKGQAAVADAASPWGCLRPARIVPPGSV